MSENINVEGIIDVVRENCIDIVKCHGYTSAQLTIDVNVAQSKARIRIQNRRQNGKTRLIVEHDL